MAEHEEAAATDRAAEELSLPLVSLRRERARRLQKLQHVVPAFVLLGAGLHGLMQGERGIALALAIGEIAVSIPVLGAAVKELAAVRRPPAHTGHHHGVDWFDIFVSAVLAVEVLEHWHTHHHLRRPILLLAILTLAMGLFHGRFNAFMARRSRSLHIDAAGIRVRSRFFRQFFAPWPDIERIDLDDSTARIVARSGQERRIDLTDLRNSSEVRQALFAARERLASPAAPPG